MELFALNPAAVHPDVFDALDTPSEQPAIPIDKRITEALAKIDLDKERKYAYDLYLTQRRRLGYGTTDDNYFGLFLGKMEFKYATLTESVLYKPLWMSFYRKNHSSPMVLIRGTYTYNTPAMHFVFLRIISACDSAHDFTPEVFKSAYAELQKTETKGWFKIPWSQHTKDFHLSMREAISKGTIRACVQTFGEEKGYKMLMWCITVIAWLLPEELGYKLFGNIHIGKEKETACVQCLSQFLLSNTHAKSVVSLITKIIGIQVTTVSSLRDTVSTPDMGEIYRTMNPRGDLKKPVKITIDATTSGFNNSTLLQSILSPGPASLFSRWFSSQKFFGFVEDSLVNDFDPASCGIVSKTAKTVGAYVKFTGDIIFNVSFDIPYDDTGTGTKPTILNAKISQIGDKVECKCITFYGEEIDETYDAKNVCISKCAKNIILKYSNYTTWDDPKMYSEVYKIALGKHLGDFMISLKHIGDDGEKLAVSVDRIMANFTALGSKTMIMEGGTGADIFSTISIFEGCTDKAQRIQRAASKRPKTDGSSTDPASSFGSSTTRIKYASKLELKNKLKSVGIKITKTIRGKRKYLSRKELENKAILFNKLQNTAKRMKIKIMYISRNGNGDRNRIYKYKTYKRLQKEIKKMKNKMKMYNSRVKNFNFG